MKRHLISTAGLLAAATLGVLPLLGGSTMAASLATGDASEAIRTQTRDFVAGYNSGDVLTVQVCPPIPAGAVAPAYQTDVARHLFRTTCSGHLFETYDEPVVTRQ